MLRVFHHYVSGRKLGFFLAETGAVALACLGGALSFALVMAPEGASVSWETALPMVVLVSGGFVAALQFALYLLDLYDLRVASEDRQRGNRLLKAAGLATLVVGGLSVLLALLLPQALPQGTLVGGAIGALAGTLAVRTPMPTLVGEPSRVLILGDGPQARAVARAVEEGGEGAYRVLSLVGLPLPQGEPLEEMALRMRADFVVMAFEDARGADVSEELLRCRLAGCNVYDAAGFCERVLRRIPVLTLRASHFAFADELHMSPWRTFSKRALDIAVSGALLVLALPLLLLVALAIKLDSRGPIFYGQDRVGRGGREYRLWKFRSMRTDAEKDGAVWARSNDDRVTRVGRFIRKTRIDEIPQVLNVLTGDMSFVGPRPERMVFVQQLKQQIPFYGLREAVKPGLTGWAQIRYPYGASVEDARNKLEYDLYYIKNGSLFLDLAIIFHTVRHVLTARGAR